MKHSFAKSDISWNMVIPPNTRTQSFLLFCKPAFFGFDPNTLLQDPRRYLCQQRREWVIHSMISDVFCVPSTTGGTQYVQIHLPKNTMKLQRSLSLSPYDDWWKLRLGINN